MQEQPQRKYVLEDIMKRRKKDKEGIMTKLSNKIALKATKRTKKENAMKNPEKFIKRYRAAQKSYAYLKNKKKTVARTKFTKSKHQVLGKLVFAIRIRGVTDISEQQKIILNKLKLRTVNSAVFMKGTSANLKQLKKVENYITYGEPSAKVVKDLIFKKMYGKVGNQRILINTNQLVEKHLGGDIICLEDVVNQVVKVGEHFKDIMDFIYPFKLTTPPGTLMSRMRKPVSDGGHWGYRGEEIDSYIMNMI